MPGLNLGPRTALGRPGPAVQSGHDHRSPMRIPSRPNAYAEVALDAVHLDDVPGARVLAGRDHWWFVGPGGIARLGQAQVSPGGVLQPTARQRLRDLGLYAAAAPSTYALTVLTSTDCNLG